MRVFRSVWLLYLALLYVSLGIQHSSLAQGGTEIGGSPPSTGSTISGTASPTQMGYTVAFSGGKWKVTGSGGPWEEDFRLLTPSNDAPFWGGRVNSGTKSGTPPFVTYGAGFGTLKSEGTISATVTLDTPDDRVPPVVVIEETLYVHWSGTSGSCSGTVQGGSGAGTELSETFGPADKNSIAHGIKEYHRITVVKPATKTIVLRPATPTVEAVCENGGHTSDPLVILAAATGEVRYRVVVTIPIVTGTNVEVSSPAPANWKNMTWTLAGQSIASNLSANGSTPFPTKVRYDSTHFTDLTTVWSKADGKISNPDGTESDWSNVSAQVVYNRFAARSAREFEEGQQSSGGLKFGKAVHAKIVESIGSVNQKLVGESVGFTRSQFLDDTQKATVFHFSAHGLNRSILDDSKPRLPITNAYIASAMTQRAHGLPVSYNVIFAASCSTARYPAPPLATSFGISDGSVDRVYAGFSETGYIAGIQAAALYFWQQVAAGATAQSTEINAMRLYQAELSAVQDDPDLSPYLLQRRNNIQLIFKGDGDTKLHGVYNPPVGVTDKLAWLLVLSSNGGLLAWH